MPFDLFFFLLLIAATVGGVWFYRKKMARVEQLISELLFTNDEMRTTMCIGIYNRFKREEGKEENPWDFEYFVARIMEDYYGGATYVTKASGDFGVDVEHKREGMWYLGQVKCYENPVGFEPIAIIHSQMIKQNAAGGFVVTTSSFTEPARKYAQDLNIELIDGKTLVQYWAEGIEKKKVINRQPELSY